jgi:molybdenum cofactor cytidylyltransferase
VIVGVVLAAGASTRMGRPKALLPTGTADETFVRRLVTTLYDGGLQDVVVVTRPDLALDRAFAGMSRLPRVVENANPEDGQLSSLVAALSIADRPGVAAVLVTTVDQPFVSPATVAALLDAYSRADARIVRPVWDGRHGHPVIFERSLFDELRRADRAVGAQAVVRAHAASILDVQVDDEGAFIDIDTPADYERVVGTSVPAE